MKRDIHIEVTNRIIEQLAQGTRPWTKPWTTPRVTVTGSHGFLPLRSTGQPYTGINVLLLLSTGYVAGTHWFTYHQAVALGGQVRKGEKGTGIVFFKPLKVDDRANPGKTKTIPLLRGYTVFNVAQIDGLPERFTGGPVEQTVEGVKQAEIERDEAVEAYLANVPAKLQYGGDRAYFAPSQDLVVLPLRERFTSSDGYYDTHLHELGHWTGHAPRLDRKFGAAFGDDDYAREELVAELTSAILCAGLGVNRGELRPDHASYIQSWLTVLKNDPKAVFQAAAHAQRAVDHLNSYQPQAAAEEAPEEGAEEVSLAA